ncbi:MAG: sulfatase-like hydrolase/transferase [Victivallaceae bacterium]|nr:sulfatase-like hydrolase/transferase [Victivallaceae bacterium]
MKKRPNVLWLMSDQHNANCSGYAGNPDVKTPNLDRIAAGGVNFTNGFANNPICSPSRICFMTGQYMHTHQLFGNDHAEYLHHNSDTLACQFRRYGYQTGLFGKSHMIRCWDEDGFEKISYTDLCDARRDDPRSTHYFKYLDDLGLADNYEEGSTKPGQEYMNNGSGYSTLPYEHSIERYTGDETLKFIEERDESRPFFIHMSFQRPHAPIAPSKEFYEMYDPSKIILPDSKHDWLENRFAGKPQHLQDQLNAGCEYPLAADEPELRRCIASYYGLISAIDMEIGRVLDRLKAMGELDNTIIFYTADHGDFAGEHGLFHKNFGLYESIQRIPFLFSWPGAPLGAVSENLVESVDLYPTLCELCNIPLPENIDGTSLVNYATAPGKDAVFCEWESFAVDLRLSSIRTENFRLVFYGDIIDGELYDRSIDPGEVNNLWNAPEYAEAKMELVMRLLDFTLNYHKKTAAVDDRKLAIGECHSPTKLLHKNGIYWSDLQTVYNTKKTWPPKS